MYIIYIYIYIYLSQVRGVSIPLFHIPDSQMTKGILKESFTQALELAKKVYETCQSFHPSSSSSELDLIHFEGSTLDQFLQNGHGEFTTVDYLLAKHFPKSEFPQVRFSTTASEFLIGNCYTLVASIFGVRHGRKECMYFIDGRFEYIIKYIFCFFNTLY